MAYDVKVKIDLAKPIGKVGFGVPLLLVEYAVQAVEYVKVSSLDEVVAAGFAASTTVYKAAQLMFAQKGAPKQIALCAASGSAVEKLNEEAFIAQDWRQLIVITEAEAESASTVSEISAAVEKLDGKMYFAGLDVSDTDVLNVSGIMRTVLFYCNATEAAPVPEAALVGRAASMEAGSFTYKNLILTGILPQKLTEAQVEAIHKKGGITFIAKAGDNVTTEGKVAGGEYIDIIDSEDYIIQQLTYRTQKLLNKSDKVPYDNNGIAMLESVAVDVLHDAYNNGMIANNADGAPDYSVAYALRADTSAEDRAARRYLGGTFRFALAGAVHEVEITGEITV